MSKCTAVFLYLLGASIAICGILLLIIATLGFISAPKHQAFYNFIKDHGSLLAGMISFVGVIWLILSQKKETKKILDSNFKIMKNEAFEAKRIKSLEGGYAIREKITSLYGGGRNNDFYFWNKYPKGRSHFDAIEERIFFIEGFLRRRGERESYSLGAIKAFIKIYNDPCWLDEKKDSSYHLGRFMFLLGLIGEIERDKIDSHYLHYDPHARIAIEEDPKIFSVEFDGHNSYMKMQHIMAYMVRIVIPDLISKIDNKAIS